jgi:hypothetical protein
MTATPGGQELFGPQPQRILKRHHVRKRRRTTKLVIADEHGPVTGDNDTTERFQQASPVCR